jgi:uncharacterized protein (PEP-CTERM system associated)
MSDLLATAIPDPVAREEAVRRRLAETGQSGNTALSGFFVSAQPIIYRNDEASVALLGVVNTATLTVSRREQRGFGVSYQAASTVPLNEDVRRTGASANWSHRFSPLTSVTVSGTWLRTEDLTGVLQDARQKSYGLFVATRLGPRTGATFGVRRGQLDSDTPFTSYRENAVYGLLSIRL